MWTQYIGQSRKTTSEGNMADPLAKFRKQPPALVATPAPPDTGAGVASESEPYVAFDAKDKVNRLRILRAKNPARAPGSFNYPQFGPADRAIFRLKGF